MRDIQLERNGNGTYDWKFDGLDTVNVIGEEAYRSKIVHALLLRNGELSQEPYTGLGSRLQQYIHSKNSESMNEYIREGVCGTCSTLEGVSDARCSVSRDNERLLIGEIVLLLDDGREVNIDAI